MKTLYIKQFNEVCTNFITDVNLVTENANSSNTALFLFINRLRTLSNRLGSKFNEMNFKAVETLLVNYTLISDSIDIRAIAVPAVDNFINDVTRNYSKIDEDFASIVNTLVESIKQISDDVLM